MQSVVDFVGRGVRSSTYAYAISNSSTATDMPRETDATGTRTRSQFAGRQLSGVAMDRTAGWPRQ